ncbi:Hypothetical predicted protein [Xyrichtys novacula]|uniref:Uncharacterized protein n=1 Tax=Xyrichtys novacula TaxID=13765 RepID=A0AAV1FGQ6_XYRNO|nr:Hypothetical predicted protein [Xyrichtys novacula]
MKVNNSGEFSVRKEPEAVSAASLTVRYKSVHAQTELRSAAGFRVLHLICGQQKVKNTCREIHVRLYVNLQDKKGTSSLSKHKTNTINRLAPPTSNYPKQSPEVEINRSKIFMFPQKSIDVNQIYRVHAVYQDRKSSSVLFGKKVGTPVHR